MLSTHWAVDEAIVVVNTLEHPHEQTFDAELVITLGLDFLLDDV